MPWDFSKPEGRLEHGKRIQAAIMQAGYESLPDFAEALGCSRALVYRYANGTTLPRLDVMQRIAQLTSKPLPYFYVEGPDDPYAGAEDTRAEMETERRRLDDEKRAFERRLREADQIGLQGRADALMRLGASLAAPPSPIEAAEVYAQVAALAGELGERTTEARACLRRGNCLLQLGRFEEAVRSLRSALEIFASVDMPVGISACRQSLVSALQSMGEFEEALGHGAALASSQEPETRWAAILSVAAILEQMGRTKDAWAQIGRAEEELAAARGGDIGSFEQTYVLANRANVAIAWGRYRAAARYARRAAEAAREAGLHDQGLEADLTYGLCLLRTGEPGAALPHLDRAVRLAEMAGDQARQAAAQACLAEWHTYAGRLEEARENGRIGLDVSTRSHSAMPELFAHLALAKAHLLSGLVTDADSHAKRAVQTATGMGAALYVAWGRLMQAEVACYREEEGDRALRLIEPILLTAREAEARHLLAEAIRVSAVASLGLGRRGQAASAAREAVTLADDSRLPFTALLSRVTLCRALGPGDERTMALVSAHEAILELADSFAKHNANATLLRLPDVLYVATELAEVLGLDAEDAVSLRYRDSGAAALADLIPAQSIEAARRDLRTGE